MGLYINIGITYEMKMYKKDLDRTNVKIEDLLKSIEEKLYLNMINYKIIEEGEFYIFKAKEEIFNVKNIILFLENQFELMNVDERQTILKELNKMQKSDELVSFAKEKKHLNFSSDDFIECIVIAFNRVNVYCSSIVIFLEGKAYLEGYDNLFKYIKNLIKVNSDSNVGDIVQLFLQ